MKRMIKNAACVLLWVCVSLFALFYMNRVLIVKSAEGVTDMQNFYLQKRGTVDVLLLGSSHTGINLTAETLWSEYGMASYALWGGIQPFWNTYHFLVEALKTQQPKAVVLDVYAATFAFEYEFDEGKQLTNTAGMRPSLNKWEAIKVSAPEDRWLDLFFGFPLYHERVYELTREDYQHFPWTDGLISDKGTQARYGVGDGGSAPQEPDMTRLAEIDGKEEEYLRKIISLCQEKDIPILLIKTPIAGKWVASSQPTYNRVAQIAQEYGVPFLDMNLPQSETGIGEGDFDADDNHMNINGARKATRRLGRELQALFDIPDRRGNPRYESWEENARQTQAAQYAVQE